MRLGRHTFADDAMLVMAIVNRTPDSFYDKGATFAEDKAMERVDLVVREPLGPTLTAVCDALGLDLATS